jgi:hypothetical protein
MAKEKSKELLYKEEGLRRSKIRKAKRKVKRAENKRYNYSSATWYEGDRCMQNCEMGGTCEFPCCGDC